MIPANRVALVSFLARGSRPADPRGLPAHLLVVSLLPRRLVAGAGFLALSLALAGCQSVTTGDKTGQIGATPAIPASQIVLPSANQPPAATVLPQAGQAADANEGGASLETLNRQADGGDPLAQIRMGLRYAKGRGVPQDDEKAFDWYRRAAERNVPLAQFLVAEAHFHGRGVRQDDGEALHWFQQAADQGFTRAQLMLGTMYALGRGTGIDPDRAATWYRKAAAWGEADAQYLLGRAYREGDGVEQDDGKAIEWFMKAARQGHIDAQVMVGLAYQKGRGVEQDYRKAVVFYGAAAEDGSAVGSLMLGLLYEAGAGVRQDPMVAFALARLAALRSPATPRIVEIRDRLQRRLEPDQVREGERLSERLGEPGQFFATLAEVARLAQLPRRQI